MQQPTNRINQNTNITRYGAAAEEKKTVAKEIGMGKDLPSLT